MPKATFEGVYTQVKVDETPALPVVQTQFGLFGTISRRLAKVEETPEEAQYREGLKDAAKAAATFAERGCLS